ncbi:MAG: cytochrome C oxidase subunit IV family protein [Anaerolineae bacterium]|jgi:cytochrome c oxidase subunit 4
MDLNFLWVLAIAAGLLILAGGMGAALAFLFGRLFPIEAAPPPEAEEEAAPVPPQLLAARSEAYRRGIYVFGALGVLTAVEFGLALATDGSAVFLFIAALVKAGLIVQYYMHLGQLVGEEESH